MASMEPSTAACRRCPDEDRLVEPYPCRWSPLDPQCDGFLAFTDEDRDVLGVSKEPSGQGREFESLCV